MSLQIAYVFAAALPEDLKAGTGDGKDVQWTFSGRQYDGSLGGRPGADHRLCDDAPWLEAKY
ncbi:hypothetical protein EN820_45400 [bacterium M00.F.Ca.ET.177.01.1.1]|nr:hypothetical protein EN820_45400 [bacterium M00.F.Ca.ET.177.01.1.1]